MRDLPKVNHHDINNFKISIMSNEIEAKSDPPPKIKALGWMVLLPNSTRPSKN
jgi:hypothetical protein